MIETRNKLRQELQEPTLQLILLPCKRRLVKEKNKRKEKQLKLKKS